MWIHQQQNWPNFTWNAKTLAFQLADIRHRQGRLLGRMEGLGFELGREASLSTLTHDIVSSSAVEGTNLDPKEVRLLLARRLGMNTAEPVSPGRQAEGIVEVMLDATQQFSKPLTKDRLLGWHTALLPAEPDSLHETPTGGWRTIKDRLSGWHAALFSTGHGDMHKTPASGWRTIDADPVQLVAGSADKEKVRFEAPGADRLEAEMHAFLEWFAGDGDTDPVVRVGIAHLWFLTIRPFGDGNGRIARAVTDMALARADGTQDRFYSLSSQMEAERRHYYDLLEKQQRATLDITGWLSWFLDCFGRAIGNAEARFANPLFKAQFWNAIHQKPVNDRQRLIINHMLEDGFEGSMNTSKYAELAKCSNDTALRDIQELKAKAILIQNPGGGRSTSYRLMDRKDS